MTARYRALNVYISCILKNIYITYTELDSLRICVERCLNRLSNSIRGCLETCIRPEYPVYPD